MVELLKLILPEEALAALFDFELILLKVFTQTGEVVSQHKLHILEGRRHILSPEGLGSKIRSAVLHGLG